LAKRIKIEKKEIDELKIDKAVNVLIDAKIIIRSNNGYLVFIKQPFVDRKKKPAVVDARVAALRFDRQSEGQKRRRYKVAPSERPQFSRFAVKGKIESWKVDDFIGLYLSRFKKHYGEEDYELALDTLKEFNSYRARLKSFVSRAFSQYELKHVFDDDAAKERLRNYINWIFDEFLPSDDSNWIESQISFGLIFNLRRAPVLKRFRAIERGERSGKTRKRKDDDWSKKETWKQHVGKPRRSKK